MTLRDTAGEIKVAVRLLTRRRAFTAVALVTLALGIGAPAAIFSVVHAVLLRPLPYPDPERLLRFGMEGHGPAGRLAIDALPTSSALEWAADAKTITALALFNERALTLSSAEGPFRLSGIAATPNLFAILGVSPAIGAGFDGATADPQRVILSHDTWQRFFGANPAVIGTRIVLDGSPYLVTGVMPERFAFPSPETAFWVPVEIDAGSSRGMVLPAIGRLHPSATVAAALQEGARFIEDDGGGRMKHTLTATTMQEQMVGGVRRVLWVLMAAVSLVFVIATANIALLLLTRGAGRAREFSIRLALGAQRRRLVRQLLVEALTLAVLGGAAGLLLGALALQALTRLAPADMPRLHEAALTGPVLAFATGLIIVTSLVFGVLSAGHAVGADPVRSLGRLGGDPIAGAGRSSRHRLNVLAAGELALTMVLLVAAGLLLRSFVRVVLVDQGFRHRGALALQINLPTARYPSPAARVAFHERLLERLRQVPGIESAGLTTAMPNRQPSARMIWDAAGVPVDFDPMTVQVTPTRTVSEGFLEALGVPLRAGRTFTLDDREGAEPVMIISEQLAKQQFPGRDPVGKILYSGQGDRRVIGVVGDVRPAAAGEAIATAAYLPLRQDEDVFRWFGTVTVVVRTADAGAAAASLRTLVLSLDPDMPPFNVRTMSDEVSRLVAGPRFSATLLAVFAGVALVLAAVGVYGVMAYAAGLRTREIGVRLALGATRAHVLRLMLRDGIVVVAAGLAAGLISAVWLSRGLTGLLHEVTPADPLALTAVAALLSMAGLLAAYVPARRATRVSALEALREE